MLFAVWSMIVFPLPTHWLSEITLHTRTDKTNVGLKLQQETMSKSKKPRKRKDSVVFPPTSIPRGMSHRRESKKLWASPNWETRSVFSAHNLSHRLAGWVLSHDYKLHVFGGFSSQSLISQICLLDPVFLRALRAERVSGLRDWTNPFYA